ncbi:MAG: response regulator [Rhodobacterales bacterium]|nr:MAG: response regulator [Rhodobacterales bacterium]
MAELRAAPFDAVLLDLLMPVLDGYGTLVEIKRDAALAHLPVIMISALDELSSVVRCIERGAEDYLHRPSASAPLAEWDNYLHLRDNPAGVVRDLWYHEQGCAQWLVVTRNTVTHEISGVELVAERTVGRAK